MPWQAHVFIGERLHDLQDARRILAVLGDDRATLPDGALRDALAHGDEGVPITLTHAGRAFDLAIKVEAEGESEVELPDHRAPEDREDDTWAVMGVALTSRYAGT